MRVAFFLATFVLAFQSGQAQFLTMKGSVPLTPREDVAVAGSNAFVVGANSLSVVSFSSPSSPSVIGQLSPGVGTLASVSVRGDYVYCAGQTSGIVVIDISDPSDPTWVRNVQAAAPVEHLAVGDTFLAVATGLNVSFFGLSHPDQPHLLTSYGRAANRLVVDAAALKIHCAGTTGAFVLNWVINQGVVSLNAFDEFGSNEYTNVALGGTYANYAQGLQFSALNKTTYTLAGQYGASAQITALTSGQDFSVVGLATGGIDYLRQTSGTPQNASSVQATGGVRGLAFSSSGQWLLAATSAGVSVIENSPLGVDPIAPQPEEFSLSAYPNPFNSTTTVSWTGLTNSQTTIAVIDLLGREVYRESASARSQSLQLDFSGLAAGSYVITLTSAQKERAPLRVVYLP